MRFLQGNRVLPKWFIPIFIIWGLLVAEVPAQEERLLELSIFLPRLIVFTILGMLFYYLWRSLNKWIVFILAPILGVAMEFGFMRPEDIPFGNIHNQKLLAALFFALAWTIIIIPPYFITTFLSRKLKFNRDRSGIRIRKV